MKFTVALIVPPLVAVVLWRDPSLLRNARAIAGAILAAALPLISYVYVYLRGALHPEWWGRGSWPSPQAWFWSFISTAQGRAELGWAFEPGRTFFGNGFPEMIWQELSLPLLVAGLLGLLWLPRRHVVLLTGTLLLYTAFCWLYRFGNWFQVVLPAYPLILIGVAAIFRRVDADPAPRARWASWLLIGLISLTVAWRVQESLPAANSRHRAEDTALDRAMRLLDQPLPQDARLFASVDDALAINYLVEIWGVRPDLKTLNSRDADDDLADGEPVFASVDATSVLLAELTTPVALNGFSPDWIILTAQPATVTPSATPLHIVTPTLLLADFSVRASPSGDTAALDSSLGLDVLLEWHLLTGIWPPELAISLRPTYQGTPLTDPATGQLIQQDRPRPLFGLWRDTPSAASGGQAARIIDPYRLPLPASLPHQPDGLLLILYTQTASGFQNVAEIALPLDRP